MRGSTPDIHDEATPDIQDEAGRTGLHQAAVEGDVKEVELLLASGANPNTQDAHLQTPITLAAERGLHDVVKILAGHGATDINLQDSFGRTPLHWCAKRCDIQLAKALLGTGKANVNVKTTGGDTALHWACSAEGGKNGSNSSSDTTSKGSVEECSFQVVELLIGAGADVRAKNDRGEKPMDLVKNEAVLALLLSAAQELDKREEDEAADAERSTASENASTSTTASNPTATAPMEAAAGWPAKQQQQKAGARSTAFTKQGTGGGVTAGSARASVKNVVKKKVVIKLNKKA